MEYNEITIFKQSIEACADPAEIARKVKLAFKKMPEEEALTCFAKVMTLGDADSYRPDLRDVKKMAQGNRVPLLIYLITHSFDFSVAIMIREQISDVDSVREIVGYRDGNGNNLLWHLTYRDDQNAQGGFACPCIERELLRLGVDPTRRNNIGLCWNDVKRHVIRQNL